jgi:hypothetical protein
MLIPVNVGSNPFPCTFSSSYPERIHPNKDLNNKGLFFSIGERKVIENPLISRYFRYMFKYMI